MVKESTESTHVLLEKEIANLSAELKTLRPEKEAEKEALKAIVKSYSEMAQPAMPTVKPGEDQQKSLLPKYLDLEPKQIKLEVEKLVDLAWHKGIKIAARAATGSSSLVMDAFHDTLTDKLYEEFKKRKLIK